MGYPVCPCGRLLADIQLDYDKGVFEINDNNKLTVEEKNKKFKELIEKFHLKRYCCIIRLKTPVNLVNVIM